MADFEERLRSEAHLKAIEQRLARIESFLKLTPPAAPVSAPPPPPPAVSPAPIKAEAPLTLTPDMLASRPAARNGNWLGVVAVICFVLAAGFIIKLSIDSGWLTPGRQLGLAAVFGLGLIGAGFGLMRSDREYASLLPGAGVIVLYLTAFAAHRVYSFITFETAISMTSLISGLCVWLYTEIREDLYPVTAAIGSYFAPVILLGGTETFTVYYFLICSLAYAIISIWVKSRTLTVISAYLAIMMTALIGLSLKQDHLVAGMLALNFVVFSAGTYLYTRQTEAPLTERESWSFLPVLMFFYAMEYYYINRIQPGMAPYLSLAFAGVLLGLYLSAKKWYAEGSLGSQPMILAFITVVCFHSFYIELLPELARPWLFVAIALLFVFLPLNLGGGKSPYRIPALGLLAVVVIEYVSMVSHLLINSDFTWLPVSLGALASLWVLISFRGEEMDQHNQYGPLLGAAHLLAVLGFYRLTKDAGSLEVSISWLVYAAVVIAYAYTRRDETMAKSAMFVLAFAACKALLYDAASAPTVVRIVCLLLTGAALYGSGFLMRRISAWKTEKPAQP